MRVAFVSNVIHPYITGGAQKRIHEIGTRLADKGHDITIYGRHFWDGPKEITHKGMTLRAVSPEHELYTGSDGERSIMEALKFAKDVVIPLRRRLDEHDVIVASVFPYFPVLAAQISTLGKETPVVTTWHEVWRSYWEEYLGALATFGKIVERLTARVPQYPIAVSDLTADRLTKLGAERTKVRTVPNGIDYASIQETPPADHGFDVLFAGRLISDKHVDILLNAFDRGAPADATLGIVGDGPKRDALEMQAQALDSSHQITFLGFLDEYEEVLKQMRAADVFVSPSTREGFGITAVEAMAAGCTVIGADHPDSAVDEVVDNAGFLANPTAEDVAPVLERALCGEQPSMEPQTRAREFDWDRVAESALEAYTAAVTRDW
jgi:glycosyltransferase involved in cell wall biosynthesis